MTDSTRRRTRVPLLAVMTVVLAACSSSGSPSPTASADPAGCPTSAPTAQQAGTITADAGQATVVTNLGTVVIELYPDAAPIATANFVALARCGFYAGITFHRVLAGFVIQAGDPRTRDNRGPFEGLGNGGPGYQFVIEPVADGYDYEPYMVAMAHSQLPDSNGSQFFIDLVDLRGRLPREYTIFGRVVDGTEVVDAIGLVAVNNADAGVPLEPVIIQSVTIGAANVNDS
jgi:cyclophilin family peptidyl-prolyl cis-trans isomerase